jgi:epoxyqueuosine reductase
MREAAGVPFDARLGVDDAPVQERVYAARAGLGWIGKNTCVINPEIGSWLVLGEIATSLDLEPDGPVFDQCGTCRLCLDACPTQAIVEPCVVDARRCLSYLTIEIRKSIPEGQRPDLGAHVFGCDICQDVCPYNSNVAPSTDPAWRPRSGLDRPSLAGLWTRSDSELEALIDGTALSRRGVAGLRRNLAVALGNSGNPAFSGVLSAKAAGGETVEDPTVAEHVSWAVRRLTRPPET